MDQVLVAANVLFNLALAVLFTWAVMSTKVRDGVLIKLGLMCMAVGHGMVAWHMIDGMVCSDLAPLTRARFVSHLGVGIALFGLWRRVRGGASLGDLVQLRRQP